MANTTNYNWETPDDTDLVKDGAAAIRTLGSSIDTTTKNLNPQTTTGALAYRSATANVNTALPIGTANQVLRVNSGGTAPEWATTADQTPLTTKGDLFGFDTADARIPIGTNGHILTADSTQSLGLKWAAPAASGALTKISSNAFSNVASVTIDNCFTSTYTDYLVIINNIYAGTTTDDILMQLRYSTSTQATDYYGSSYLVPYTGSNSTIQTNAGTSFQISNNIGSSTYRSTGQIFFSRVGNTSEIASWRGQLLDEGDTIATHFAGKANVARTYTGLLFKSSSSNITGNITIYGLEK